MGGISNSRSLESDDDLISVKLFDTSDKQKTDKKMKSQEDKTNTQDNIKKNNKNDANSKILSIFEEPEKKEKKTLIVPIVIKNLKDYNPIFMELDKKTPIKLLQRNLNKLLGLNKNTLQCYGQNKIPNSYRITIGDENRYDFSNNIFIIHPNTTFIEYFNDMIEAANVYIIDNQNDNNINQLNHGKFDKYNIKNNGNLNVNISDNNKILNIDDIQIRFNKTLKIPKTSSISYELPSQLGAYNIFKAYNYINKISNKWKKQKGIIIPMHQNEALWLSMKCNLDNNKQYALKIGISDDKTNKINAINGNKWKNKYLTQKPKQNYIVLPKQTSLECINNGNNTFTQFIQSSLIDTIQMEIYSECNSNVHISTKKEIKLNINEYDKSLLDLTPIQAGFNINSNVYFFSHNIPKLLWRDCAINDIFFINKTNQIDVHCNNNEAISKFIEYSKMMDNQAVIINDNNNKQQNNNNLNDIEDYLIKAVCYLDEDPFEYKIMKLGMNGLNTKIISDNLYFKPQLNNDKNIKKKKKLKSNLTLKQQGLKCGDLLFKIKKTNKILIYIKFIDNDNDNDDDIKDNNNDNNDNNMDVVDINMDNMDKISFNIYSHYKISSIKNKIKQIKNVNIDQQKLIFNNQILKNDETLNYYNIKTQNIINCYLLLNKYRNSINIPMIDRLVIGNNISPKIFQDNMNTIRYNMRSVTRIYIHIINGLIWKRISASNLPHTNINQETYKLYGIPWFKEYSEIIQKPNGVNKADNVKSNSKLKKKKNNDNQKKNHDHKIAAGNLQTGQVNHVTLIE